MMKRLLVIVIYLMFISSSFAALKKPFYRTNSKPPLGSRLDPTNPLSRGLYLYWPLNENGGKAFTDISGNTGLANATSTPAWSTGPHGSAINFPGTNFYIFSNSNNVVTFKDFTISAWIKVPVANANVAGPYRIISHQNSQYIGMVVYGDGVSSSYLTVLSSLDSITYPTAGGRPVVNDATWHLFTIVRDTTNSLMRTYVDGIQRFSQSCVSTSYNDGAPWQTSFSGDAEEFFGSVEGIMVWNRALSPTEIMGMVSAPYSFFAPTYRIILDANPQVPSASGINKLFKSLFYNTVLR